MEPLAGWKAYIIGGGAVILGVLVLAGLTVKALPSVTLILGGLGLIALRLAVRKVEGE